jgi:hypothetical protein
MNYLKKFYAEAKNKVTTYVGLGVTAFSTLALKSEDLLNSMPQLKAFLPAAPRVQAACTTIAAGLGILTVYTRVRRLLRTP